jgi:eukaryotic-like serine/threonine-protein kinase
MGLQEGTRFGSYEIVSPLGAGGMGEVYRARDTKLNRQVALKVLPQSVAGDSERMARFKREAQALASLNHPNIATIHGLEESGGALALVMELVEGQTLAELLETRNSKLEIRNPDSARATSFDPLPIAKQIAEALEYAHERGIIHRDLKPANVMVTPEGAVKVLDFGLAKALDAEAASSNISNSPTLTVGATRAGVILGTAAYMAPEQARGKSADRRADIWSFGCVLYEMLSGRKLFEAETVSDTLAAVLTQEPDWSGLPETTPGRIRQLIRRCLTKDAKRRLQAIGEARIAIEETISGTGGPPVDEHGQDAHATAAGMPLRRVLLMVAAAVVLVLAGMAGGRWLWQPSQISWTGTILGGPELCLTPRLSPDGRMVAFVGNDPDGVLQLWVTQPATGNRIMLTHNRELGYAQNYSWSQDGSRIYYDRWNEGPKGIYSVPALGGDEKLVVENAMDPQALPDGSLLIVRLNAGHRFQVFHYWPETGKSQPYDLEIAGAGGDFLRSVPGGHEGLVIGSRIGPGAEEGVHLYVVDVATGNVRQLPEEVPGEFGARTVAVGPSYDGKYALISTARGSLYQIAEVPLDGRGPTRTLLDLTSPIFSLDIGADGSIYLDQYYRESEIVRFSPTGGRVERVATIAYPDNNDSLAVLPDGRIVSDERTASHTRLILIEAGKTPSPLVNTTEDTAGPMTALGPDHIAFMIGPLSHRAIAMAALSDGRITQRLNFDQGIVTQLAATPDGKNLYCVAGGAVWLVPLTGEAPRKLHGADSVAVDAASHSLVIEVREPPVTRLVRIPLAGGPEQEITGTFPLGYHIGGEGIRNGKLVAPLAAPYWYWPPGIFDLATGKSERIPLDYTSDFHYMAWAPDGKVVALALGYHSKIWEFTPEKK